MLKHACIYRMDFNMVYLKRLYIINLGANIIITKTFVNRVMHNLIFTQITGVAFLVLECMHGLSGIYRIMMWESFSLSGLLSLLFRLGNYGKIEILWYFRVFLIWKITWFIWSLAKLISLWRILTNLFLYIRCPVRRSINVSSLSWTSPREQTVKVNVDGSHRSSGQTACGGLIRDVSGKFINGFYCNLGSSNAAMAE